MMRLKHVNSKAASAGTRVRRHCCAPVAPRHVAATVAALAMLWLQLGCDGSKKTRSEEHSSTPPQVSRSLVPLTNMILIKAGTFMRQKHPVTLTRDFWLGKYEVTQGEYEAIMGQNPSRFQGDIDTPAAVRTNRPVEKVRYYEAVDYCAALTRRESSAGRVPPGYAYRLPTEAEWEYACRAGTTNLYSFGDDPAEAEQYAWTLENSNATTHPVGLKRPNPWGFYDIHGNVWEWTSDWFAEYPDAPLTDPAGPPKGTYKVFRGGSWNHALEFARSRNRFMMPPTNGIYFVGFRIALSERR